MTQRMAMIPLLLAAVALSFVVPWPYGIIQAAICGFSLGVKVEMIMDERAAARRKADK